ncbi:translation initiation factor [Taibaiella sp. KBW10]|uniref:translation initiation factor n=1 Tax=Taibaiella sp. KBW10 TaxID=2153357 RepID=UPI000F5B817C|nr:translation initiation factor [Taibaiella sp. KBW10]RQO32394.1 translation initiation factor [Taibaiella sp. KBW10]
MSKQKKLGLGALGGLVFSTNPDAIQPEPEEEMQTLAAGHQKLRVLLDKKQRAGKVVTLIDGFEGTEEDFQSLAKQIKTKCGTGGSAKDGMILIQGDYKVKIAQWLKDWGYTKTKTI